MKAMVMPFRSRCAACCSTTARFSDPSGLRGVWTAATRPWSGWDDFMIETYNSA
jgi:hypothetical protein